MLLRIKFVISVEFFQTAVSKDTTYLVAGGKVGASKLKKAEQYGTKIIDEQELLKMISDADQ